MFTDVVGYTALMGKDEQKAFALLKKNREYGKGFGKKDWIEHDPDYDSLRNEPRFIVLLNKLK